MNTYEVKGGISVFATGGHQKKGPFGKTGFSKIEKNTIFQISIRSPNRDFEKTPFFSSNLPNGPFITYRQRDIIVLVQIFRHCRI